MYDIALSFPAFLIGVSYDDFLSSCRSTRNRTSPATGIGVEVLPLYIHASSGVLSQNLPMCLNFISSTKYSSTSHSRTNSASSRSFIVNLPFVFVWETSPFGIFCGHAYFHTHGCMLWIPGVITPPDPNRHVSVYCK